MTIVNTVLKQDGNPCGIRHVHTTHIHSKSVSGFICATRKKLRNVFALIRKVLHTFRTRGWGYIIFDFITGRQSVAGIRKDVKCAQSV